MDIGFHDDVDATDAVKRDFHVFVFAPVTHAGHVDTFGLVLLVACKVLSVLFQFKLEIYRPSASTTSLSRDAASLRPVSDSCQEL